MNTTVMDKIDSDIKRVGWAAIGVMPTENESFPPFTYSVGFRSHLHPEFIIVGLDPEIAHEMLYGLYLRVSAGERFEDGQLVSDVIENYDARLCALPADGRPCYAALEYYGVEELPVLQVLWPDPNGTFPGEDGFEERFVGLQDLKEV
jgi:hypothetical protein